VSGAGGKEALLFLKKKKQKTSSTLARGNAKSGHAGDRSFLRRFFSKKRLLLSF
jgi:hypothetical protein